MAKRGCAGRASGFYKRLVESCEEVEDEGEEEYLVVKGNVLDDDVYEVERVMERRKRKVKKIHHAYMVVDAGL